MDVKFSELLDYNLPASLSSIQIINGKYCFSTLRNLFANNKILGTKIGVSGLPMKYHLSIEENIDIIFDHDWICEMGPCLHYMDDRKKNNILIQKSSEILKNFYGIRDNKYDNFLKKLIPHLKEINFMPIDDLILMITSYVL